MCHTWFYKVYINLLEFHNNLWGRYYCYLCLADGKTEAWWFILYIKLAKPRHPDIWSNTNLNVAVKVFFRWDKHLNLRHVGEPYAISWRPGEKKGWGVISFSSKEEGVLPLHCLWACAATSTLRWIYSLSAYPRDFGFAIAITMKDNP